MAVFVIALLSAWTVTAPAIAHGYTSPLIAGHIQADPGHDGQSHGAQHHCVSGAGCTFVILTGSSSVASTGFSYRQIVGSVDGTVGVCVPPVAPPPKLAVLV